MTKLRFDKDEEMWKGRFLRVIKRPFMNIESGKGGHWELVKREVHGRIVAIMAVTPEKEVILVKIFRVPLKRYVLECAAGLPDRPGEDEAELARRELLEETGYQCDKLEEVISGPLNSGLMDDVLVFFLGTGARKITETNHENAEDIEVIKIPYNDLEHYLRNPPDGMLVDLKIWALLPFLAKL
jgi:ADP-ribose pyrophosphatase